MTETKSLGTVKTMSKSLISKASAALIGFSLLAASSYPVFAKDSTNAATIKRPIVAQRLTTEIQKLENKMEDLRIRQASREAVLKTKLEAFKDQKKATISARVSANLNQINQNQTAQMQRHLDLMSSILDKLEARVNKSTSDIKNPVEAKKAIDSTRQAIATASAAVTAQAQKDYTIQVTSEGRIKLDVQTMRNKLHTDILSMRKAVIDVKQAVANAIRVAKSESATIETKEKEGTVSGRE